MSDERGARRILVVDDDDALREVLTVALTRDGHTVDGASDGTEALALLDRQPYDLVLSDLRMPRVDGPSLYETLRTRHHFPVRFATKLPRVIFMTGNAAEHADFLRGTTDPILEKPFPLRVVRQMVSVLLNASA
ncbi:MAG TPA: response regulator [Methylomirabilota bacterium]|jgi:CheY-like chemotaxis protein|nr:response regulator [Methylomirabilota bacterium]